MPHPAYFCIIITFCYILPIIVLEPGIHCNDRLYEPGRPPTQRPVCTRTARVPTRVCELTWLIRHNKTHIWHTQPRLASPTNINPPEPKHYKPRNLATPMQAEARIRCRSTYLSSPLGWHGKRNCDGRIARTSRWQTNPTSDAEQLYTQQQRQDPTKDKRFHDRRRDCTTVSHNTMISSYRSLTTHRLSKTFGSTVEDNSPQTHANPLADQATDLNPGSTPLPQETPDEDESAVYFESTYIRIAPPD